MDEISEKFQCEKSKAHIVLYNILFDLVCFSGVDVLKVLHTGTRQTQWSSNMLDRFNLGCLISKFNYFN